MQVGHTLQRSFENFRVNMFSETLIVYQLLETKPSLNFSKAPIYL